MWTPDSSHATAAECRSVCTPIPFTPAAAAATSITRSRLRGSTGAPSSVVATQPKPPLIRRAQPLGLLCGAMLVEHRHDRRAQRYGPPKGDDYLVASLIRSLVDCERRGNTRRAAVDLIGGPVFTVRCREVVIRICERNAAQRQRWLGTRRDGWDGRLIVTCTFETRKTT